MLVLAGVSYGFVNENMPSVGDNRALERPPVWRLVGTHGIRIFAIHGAHHQRHVFDRVVEGGRIGTIELVESDISVSQLEVCIRGHRRRLQGRSSGVLVDEEREVGYREQDSDRSQDCSELALFLGRPIVEIWRQMYGTKLVRL